jgi:multiple sugar transport system permease protein
MNFPGSIRYFMRKPYAWAYVFIFPTFVLMLMFHIVPFLMSFFISTLNMKLSFSSAQFVGIQNYVRALGDRYFRNAVSVTLRFTAMEIPIQMIVGLVLAAFLTKNTFFNKLIRSIYFLPIVVSATALGIMWYLILHSSIGLITYWLGLLGFGNINFLNTRGLALNTVLFVTIWRTFGISMLILVAAMQAVPDEYYDAAQIDGAGKLRQFWSITLPSIMPAFWFLLMTRIIGSLQIFDIVFTLTGGGPNFSTETLVTYIYRRAMDGSSNMGYATAMSEYLFVFILGITMIQYTIMNKTENN